MFSAAQPIRRLGLRLPTLLMVLALPLMPLMPLTPVSAGKVDPMAQWGQWHSPLQTGVAPRGKPPVSWSEERNVRWKTALPGRGHSTPIVWGDRIFVTASVPHGNELPVTGHDAEGAHNNFPPSRRHRFVVLAIDRATGKILWQRTARDQQPHEGTHVTGSWASNSAVTDGKHVFAFFGSHGLYSYSMDGKPAWEKDLGDLEIFHGHGEGASPALAGNTLIVNWDHQGDSFVVALDKRTGKERWKAARDEITSWSTPVVVEHRGKTQVIISATGRVRGYDLDTGEVIWECRGLSRNVVASPVAADGMVYVGNSYDRRALMAIRLDDAKGDITGTDAVAWTIAKNTPYVPSPLLYGDMLFFIKHLQGVLTAVRAKTGEPLFGPQRLDGIQQVFASPVGAANRVYVVDRGGTTIVLKRDEAFQVLATNHLDDSFSASPAIAGDELFLRGDGHLYCIAEDPVPSKKGPPDGP